MALWASHEACIFYLSGSNKQFKWLNIKTFPFILEPPRTLDKNLKKRSFFLYKPVDLCMFKATYNPVLLLNENKLGPL